MLAEADLACRVEEGRMSRPSGTRLLRPAAGKTLKANLFSLKVVANKKKSSTDIDSLRHLIHFYSESVVMNLARSTTLSVSPFIKAPRRVREENGLPEVLAGRREGRQRQRDPDYMIFTRGV